MKDTEFSKPTKFLKRPASELSSSGEKETFQPASRRRATVYDAVAGRVSQWGLITPQTQFNASRTTANQPLRPDEVLFKGSNAPTRYEENDHYFAHEKCPEGQKLPTGDLLSALHAYISKYYASNEEYGNQKVWKCMDETALLALGILIEETAREALGDTGDLAFLEGDEESGEVASPAPQEESLDMAHAGQVAESNTPQNDRGSPESNSWSSYDDSEGPADDMS